MSENNGEYLAGSVSPASLTAFKRRGCIKPYSDPDYSPPSPDEVDALIKLMGWSQSVAAKLVGVSYNPKKGSSTIRKWRTSVDKKDYREIPYSTWRLMLLYAGVVTIDEGLEAIEKPQ